MNTEDPVLSVELVRQTRGVRKTIHVDPQQIRIDVNGNLQQVKTQPKQWRAILAALKGVRLEDLPAMTGDVTRSSVDAALIARLRVTTATKTYESAPHDHPGPPAELVPLTKAMVACVPPESRKQF